MTAVDWEAARPQFEAMVSVMLSTIYPDAERVDGAGGDGGRDVQIRDGNRLVLFECKSFTGRIGSKGGRRAQVQRSLETASMLKPTEWNLVVPIDPTPSELAWFESLQSRYEFPLKWRGKAWLDAQLAENPRIARYFLEGTDSEVVRVLRELNREQASLANGAPEAAERMRVLKERIDELDPYYRANLAIANETTKIELVPRYRGADRDRPVLVSTSFEFPNSPVGSSVAEKLREAIEGGTGAHIPSEYVSEVLIDAPLGLGGSFKADVIIGPVAPENIALGARLALERPNGRFVAALPISFRSREKGTVAGRLFGQDSTGAIRVELAFNMRTQDASFSLRFEPPGEILPGALLPIVKWLRFFKAPNRVLLYIENRPLGEPVAVSTSNAPSVEYVEMVENLEEIQNFTSSFFPVPSELSGQDMHEIREAIQLIRGETLTLPTDRLNFRMTATSRQALLDWIAGDFFAWAAVVSEHKVNIAGHELVLGRALLHISKASLGNPEEVREHLDSVGLEQVPMVIDVADDGELTARLAVGDGEEVEVS